MSSSRGSSSAPRCSRSPRAGQTRSAAARSYGSATPRSSTFPTQASTRSRAPSGSARFPIRDAQRRKRFASFVQGVACWRWSTCGAPRPSFAAGSACWSPWRFGSRPITCSASRSTTCPMSASWSKRSSARSGGSSSAFALTSRAEPGRRGAALAAAAGGARLLNRFRLHVGVAHEHLPRLAIRRRDPDLVLLRVAAGRVHLVEGRKAGLDQPCAGAQDVVARGNLDPGVVEGAEAVAALTLVESEVERWLGDLELRVAGALLGGLDAEERAVELGRALDVAHGEGQVRSQDSHSDSSSNASGFT